jgi:D-alanyl-D-alanine dipeptidase
MATAADADRLVDVTKLAADIRVELRYATRDNFTHQVIYPPSARCYLRAGVAAQLAAVQKGLRRQGLGLKVYDCYRPRSVQETLWNVVPDERYVANPKNGSRHNRGAAVDLTLVDQAGRELVMPTPYDDFTEKAHRSYSALPAEAMRNRQLLEQVMVAQGFVPLPTEWWHFDDAAAQRYPMADVSFEQLLIKR